MSDLLGPLLVAAAEDDPPQRGGQGQAQHRAVTSRAVSARRSAGGAPMPMAATDSPRATISRALCRSDRWAGLSSNRFRGCTTSGEPSWMTSAAAHSG